MSKAECGVVGLCPMLTEGSEIEDCDQCEAEEGFLKERQMTKVMTKAEVKKLRLENGMAECQSGIKT